MTDDRDARAQGGCYFLARAASICKRSKKRRMNINDEISQIGSERVCTEAYEGSLGCHTNALYSGL